MQITVRRYGINTSRISEKTSEWLDAEVGSSR